MSIALVLITKGCPAPYLEFWVRHHLGTGVSHIYLYDNGGDVTLSGTKLTVIPWPGVRVQVDAYNHAVRNFGHLHEWVGFLDDDELLFVREGTLASFLESVSPEAAGVCLNWLMFGTSGVQGTIPDGDMLSGFRKCAPSAYGENQHVKTIARTRCIDYVASPHYCAYKGGAKPVSEQGASCSGPFSVPPSHQTVWVNHYFTRSAQDYVRKVQRGKGSSPDSYDPRRQQDLDGVCTENFTPTNLETT